MALRALLHVAVFSVKRAERRSAVVAGERRFVALAGSPVADVGDLQRLMTEDLIGTAVDVVVIRDAHELTLRLVPEELVV